MQKLRILVIAILGLVGLFAIDRSQVHHVRTERESKLNTTAQLCRNRLENAIESRLHAVEALASLFILHPSTKAEEFALFASMLLKFNPPIRALQYADAKTRVTYVYPPKNNEITISNPNVLLADPKRRAYVQKAIDQKMTTIQGPFELRQGGSGVVVRFPIFVNNRFRGLAIGVYDVPVLINEALSGINLDHFIFQLTDGRERPFWGPEKPADDHYTLSVSIADDMWNMTLGFIEDSDQPPVFTRVLIWGFGGGLLLVTLSLVQLTWKRARRLEQMVAERTMELSQINQRLVAQIDERKRAEKALKKSEEDYQYLFEHVMIGMSITNQEGRIIEANKALLELYGYTYDDIAHLNASDMYLRIKDRFKIIEQITQNGFVKNYEVQLKNKKGCSFWASITTRIIQFKGEGAFLTSLIDITERKMAEMEKNKLQAQLAHAQKMESIGNLAGGIAHDFNNILSSIIGFTELAMDDVETGTPIEDNLNEVFIAGNRAKELVKQILTYARQSEIKFNPIQIKPIVIDALKLIRSSIPTTISIKQQIESDALIMGDNAQVNQIIMNLCTNAAQAMEDKGGTLDITVKDIVFGKNDHRKWPDLKMGSYIKLMVSDTGKGMHPETMDSVFEPYFTTKAPGEGTGLGLAVVQGIVHSYKGKIIVNSKLGLGTDFTVYLPTTKKARLAGPPLSNSLPTGQERILLIDDEASIVRMGSRILERLGYSVKTRTDSEEALDLFKATPEDFDLVITDMTMPNMTGEKLAKELIKIRPKVPIILCTGYSKQMSDEKALKLGIKSFAYKPIVKSDLAITVRRVLDEAAGS